MPRAAGDYACVLRDMFIDAPCWRGGILRRHIAHLLWLWTIFREQTVLNRLLFGDGGVEGGVKRGYQCGGSGADEK